MLAALWARVAQDAQASLVLLRVNVAPGEAVGQHAFWVTGARTDRTIVALASFDATLPGAKARAVFTASLVPRIATVNSTT